MTNPRTFTLKDQAPASIAYGSACRLGSEAPRVGQTTQSGASAYSRDAERPVAAKPHDGEAGFSPAKQSYRDGCPATSTPGPGGEILPEGGFEAQAGMASGYDMWRRGGLERSTETKTNDAQRRFGLVDAKRSAAPRSTARSARNGDAGFTPLPTP